MSWLRGKRTERLVFAAIWLLIAALILASRSGRFGNAFDEWKWGIFSASTGSLIGASLPTPEKPVPLDTLLYPLIVAVLGFIAFLAWPGL